MVIILIILIASYPGYVMRKLMLITLRTHSHIIQEKLNFLEKDKKEHTGEPFSPRISWMTVPGPLESLGRIIYIVIKSIKNEIKIRTLHIL